MEVVEKHHFCLNNNAKNLKRQIPKGIVILIKGRQNMLFASIVEQLQGRIQQEQYECVIHYIEEEENELEHALQICKESHPLGILFLGSNRRHFRQEFVSIPVPCVLVTNSAEQLGFSNLSSVSTDDVAAAEFVIDYLISLGHEQIGILGGDMEVSQAAISRYKGCVEAFRKHYRSFLPKQQYESARFSISAGYDAMGRLLDKMPNLTAVFAMSDVMALGAIRAIQDRGLCVPEDISVIGFDGLEIGNYMNPRLTTIQQNKEGIALRSIEILLRAIEEEGVAQQLVEPFCFVAGESVKDIINIE
jgi:LacI family transcriptional regulator